MSRDKSRSLLWGSANRPKVSNKVGIPHPNEGSDGDIQIRQTNLGAKLFGKVGGRWNSTFLSSEDEILGTSGTSITMNGRGQITIDKLNIDTRAIFFEKNKNIIIGGGDEAGKAPRGMQGTLASISYADTNSNNNVCVGYGAMELTTEGQQNIAIGVEALQYQGTHASDTYADCQKNVAIGHAALKGDTSTSRNQSNENVAIGWSAMANAATTSDAANITCQYNTSIGSLSGTLLTGASNTFIGSSAGRLITSGDKNTFLGSGASGHASTSNQIAIGYSTVTTGQYGIAIGDDISAATNDAVMGKNGSTITCDFDTNGTWAQSSDIRKKTNIQDDTLGLDFINDLKTKTFQWKPANEHPEEWGNFSVDENDNKTYVDINTETVMHGLIAQEVKESLDKVSCSTFGGWKLRENGQQELAKASFVIPLIKAVQELSAKVDSMQIEINNLKQG